MSRLFIESGVEHRMTLPEGVLTQKSSQNEETVLHTTTENVKEIEHIKAEFKIEGTGHDSSGAIGSMDVLTYGKPNIIDIVFEILRHIPFINLIALFILYMVTKDTKRSELLILIESLTMLVVDILLGGIFFRFANLSYEQLANLFTILQ